MSVTDWHAAPDLLARFAADPAALDDPTASSIEAHLVVCATCRAALAATVDIALLSDSWAGIADRIDQPRPNAIERLLRRTGMGTSLARLLAATPALQLAGLTSVAVLAVGAALVARTADADGLFLVLAPLAPLIAVAASFAPAADPAGEAGVATPLHGTGLIVRRAAVVLAVTFALLGGASLALPTLGFAAAAWVLPALALAVGALALGTWVRTEVAVAVLATAWLSAVWSARALEGRDLPVADAATFTLAGQSIALGLAGAATTLLVLRRDRLATLEAFR